MRVHNVAHVSPRSKSGAKNQNLEKTSNLKKEYQNRMKNDRVMPIRRLRTKVAVGLFYYFRTKVGYFGHNF